MSKDLPYFKFYTNDWTNGHIALESMQVQGVFINICIFYWSRGCNLSADLLHRKYKSSAKAVHRLCTIGIVKLSGNEVKISFLDEQLAERDKKAETSRENGINGGRPKKSETQTKPSGLILQTQTEPKQTQLRGEERRGEKEENFSLSDRLQIASLLSKKYEVGAMRGKQGTGQDVDDLCDRLALDGVTADEAKKQISAMMQYHDKMKFARPQKVSTLMDNLRSNDYVAKLKQIDPEQIDNSKPFKNAEPDTIGTSEYGSLG